MVRLVGLLLLSLGIIVIQIIRAEYVKLFKFEDMISGLDLLPKRISGVLKPIS